MSYTRTFTKVIHVSGSKVVTYPASEHGGMQTVYFSENVPVSVNIHVDTNSFDNSVNGAVTSVDGMTAAVTAMDEAQRIEIRKSTEQVAESFAKGFYDVANHDISSQKAEVSSRLKAEFGKLLEESKKLSEIKDRMAEDVLRVQRHYYKIFKGLDEDLLGRIVSLNSNAFSLSHKVNDDLLTNFSKKKTGNTATGLKESSYTNNLILTGRLKEKTLDTIDQLGKQIEKSLEFRNEISSVLVEKESDLETKRYVPAIYCITSQDQNKASNTYVAEMNGSEQIKQSIGELSVHIENDQYHTPEPDDLILLEQPLLHMIEKDAADKKEDPRIYQEMMKLWNKNKTSIQEL